MRHWLSRLAFSLVVVAFVLAYTGWRAGQEGAGPWRVNAHYIGAAIALAAGLAGMRERHRD